MNLEKITCDFCNEYYTNMSSLKFDNVVKLFDNDARCLYNNVMFLGIQGILFKMVLSGLKHLSYTNLIYNYMLIDNNTFIIQTNGCINIDNGKKTTSNKFNETFIINNINGKIIVSGYFCNY